MCNDRPVLFKPFELLGQLGIICLTYVLVCSGHPPMKFYGLVGAGSLHYCTFSFACNSSDKPVGMKMLLRFWGKSGIHRRGNIAFICLRYTRCIFEFVTNNTEYGMRLVFVNGQDTFVEL